MHASIPSRRGWLWVSGAVVIGLLLWRQERSREAPARVRARALVTASSGRAPRISLRAQGPAAGGLERHLTPVHLLLRQWLQTSPHDRNTLDKLQNELQAIVTDANAAAIIQSLSAAELDTPFGLAALDHWLKTDPAAAASWVAARPDPTEDQAWAVAHQLLDDPAELGTFCAELPDTAWKQEFLKDEGQEIASQDPAAAADLAQSMAPGDARTSLMEDVATAWIGRDPDAATAWIMNLDDPALRAELVSAAASAYPDAGPR